MLGPKLEAQLASFVEIYEYPNNGNGTGGQYTGWHIWMYKDLKSVLGEKVRGPFAVRYCGAGNLKLCARLLWKAINTAGNELAATQGPNPADWHSSATAEEITFVPGILPYKMAYTNRPTGIQQILSFGGHASGGRLSFEVPRRSARCLRGRAGRGQRFWGNARRPHLLAWCGGWERDGHE